MRSAHRARLLGALLALTAGLTACAPELPQPDAPAIPAAAPPATTIEQSARILTAVGETVAAADAELSSTALSDRVSGPALTSRAAEYAVAAATSGADAPTALPVEPQTLVVPTTTEWPRTQIVITEQPDDLTSPRLLVLEQASPRAPYTLWAWARLLPGVQMPATANPSVGADVVPPDAADLVAAPADVVAQYADVLASGDGSAYAATFATPDPYRQRIAEGRAVQEAAAADGGTFAETYAAVPGQVVAHRTADGGALVVGGMTTTSTTTVTGASITVIPQYAAVSGGALPAGAVLRNNLTVGWTDVVAFYVPPAGSDAPVQVLGAEHTYTSASGS
ncbi:hypothetical protein [Cellulomonas sp. ATA003]|uniref:hypothetical protein n=1 Tax=Cellulomonas sp. ATA003 TaxID=3073064 RepID=UPI002873B32F|nr:hypothetical protein [Cellulomonas sp. ATA003]WNB84941.1 hypothetical protein REH70_14720 [Cellulomonas sp. ATA003]